MQALQPNKNPLSKTSSSLFSPFIANTLKVQGDSGFFYGSVCYSPRHNMIIACPDNYPMQFYDAGTLLPLKEREAQQLDGSVACMSFHTETDAYIMGCTDGSIYMYNASSNELKKLKELDRSLHMVAFVNSTLYAFSLDYSQKLFLGNIENEDVASFDLYNDEIYSLRHLTKRNLLLAGLGTGSVMVCHRDKLPHLRVLCSRKAHQVECGFPTLEVIHMNGKEYIMTAAWMGLVKIWHLIKGRMRLLKVIQTERSYSVVYLEKYKMIAIAEETAIKFFRFPSGKLERTVSLGKGDYPDYLFLMKEKNMIGVTRGCHNVIEFIQLAGAKEGTC